MTTSRKFCSTLLLAALPTVSAGQGLLTMDDELVLPENVLDCIIEPNLSLDISSPVEGVVSRVYADRGDVVRAGEVLMELDSDVEEAVLELATVRAEFADRTLSRNDSAADVMSSQEKDEIVTDAKIAALELNEARMRLELKKIKSPIDGLVVEKMRSEGEYVSEQPVYSVVNIDPLFVEVIAPVNLFGVTSVGSTAAVIPEAPIGGRYSARVIAVDPVIDSASGTFRIRLELPNPGSKLPSGLKCRIDFSADD